MAEPMRRWLVGSDGSPGSDHAIDWCVGYAAPARAQRLHILRAWHPPALATTGLGVPPTVDHALTEHWVDDARGDRPEIGRPEHAHPHLEQIASRLRASGVELSSSVEMGGAADLLLRRSTTADLLVVGTRGRGGFARLLLGSVSNQCATHARIPVAVVHAEARTDGVLDKVVVGVDGSPASAAALAWALDFVPADIAITIVGAWKPTSWGLATDLPLWEQDMQRASTEFHAFIDRTTRDHRSDHEVERSFVEGDAAEVLSELADETDLLVVGERGHEGLSAAVLGSVTTRVLHTATCATVVVPTPS